MCKATKMQSLLTGRVPVSSMTGPIKRGLLWQQRDRIFSRWKERYFILTRDYLHCFKRASGSSNGRASDMGQFIFKVKLVDVDKVEWLNRRSYNAIALILGREGRILLRYDDGLEDWFELLEECTQTSKERRKELKIAQGPRSRASLAAPVSHASLHSNHFALGGTSSSTVDDWLMTSRYALSGLRGQKIVTSSVCSYGEPNPFLFSDSVPDLSVLNNENHNHRSGVSTNHSTPQKIPYSASNKSKRCSDSYTSHKDSISNYNGLFNSPQRTLMNSCSDSTHIVDEETEYNEVELRRPRIFRHLSMENGNVMDRDWLYRKPKAPTDMRHSVQPMLPTHNNTFLNKLISDLDCSTHDSGLDTTSSTHRPSSYREQSRNKIYAELTHGDSAENSTSPFRETTLKSTGGSFRCKQISKNYGQHINQSNALHGSRYCVEESAKKTRNKDDFITLTKMYDQHQNRYNKNDCQFIVENGNGNDNTNYNNNNPNANNGSVAFLERHQNPTLAAIINESQSIKFRDRSFSDCQQDSPRRNANNNPSPSTRKKRNHINAIFGTPTKV